MILFALTLFNICLAIFTALGIVKFADFFIQDDGKVDDYGYMDKKFYFLFILIMTIVVYGCLTCVENWTGIDAQQHGFNCQHEQTMELLK